MSWQSSHSTTVDISEEKIQQQVAGCVTDIGGGGEPVAALEVFGKTEAVSMCPGGGDDRVTLELLARA